MPKLIKDGVVAENSWRCIAKDAGIADAINDPSNQILVHLSLWQNHKDELEASQKEIGVWLDSEDDPYDLANDAAELPLIAVNFPVFRDGRAFSSAAILRERLSFKGDLRAIGDVLRDQVFYMKKCGINSFEIEDSLEAEEILQAFADFKDSYQSTVEIPEPLFRRR